MILQNERLKGLTFWFGKSHSKRVGVGEIKTGAEWKLGIRHTLPNWFFLSPCALSLALPCISYTEEIGMQRLRKEKDRPQSVPQRISRNVTFLKDNFLKRTREREKDILFPFTDPDATWIPNKNWNFEGLWIQNQISSLFTPFISFCSAVVLVVGAK